jgi:arylsulfatase A-like enzyme
MNSNGLTRRHLLAGAAAAALRPRPNIVFILADDLGYGDIGCFGQEKIRTPNIDRLAAEGLRFTDAYAGCTVCAPSRSVLMTGLHAGHTSVRSNPGGTPLLASDFTVASLLRSAGYRTGGFGKWGLGDVGTGGVPSKHGFDRFYGYLNQAHAHFYYPRFLYDNERESPLPGNENGGRGTYSNDAMVTRALQFIRENRQNPFFCYMPLTVPHGEYLVPEDSLAQYRGKFVENRPFHNENGHLADQPEFHAAYAGMVTRLDRYVGQVTGLLQTLGLEENTLVLFASDNGAALTALGDNYFQSAGQFRGSKGTFYEGGIRVPAVARWKGTIEPGRVSRLPWAFYDFLPTAAELAGVKPPAGLDGFSIVPELRGGGKQPRHEYLYWELPAYNGKTGTFAKELPKAGLRYGDWKAVRPQPGAALELYNLQADPGESHNLAAAEPKVLNRIEGILKNVRTEPRPQKEPPNPWWVKSGTA